MTTITIEEEIIGTKTHFKTVDEFTLSIQKFHWHKRKKLSPHEIIKKYKLDTPSIWKKIDILKETNSLAYSL